MSVLILFLLGISTFVFFLYKPIIGDDVLCQFEYSFGPYLDNKIPSGDRITTLSQVFINCFDVYKFWMGRCLGVFLMPMITILGKPVTSILMGSIYILFILSISLLIFKDFKKIFEYPLALLVFILTIFYYSAAANFMTMWIMALLNILTPALYLIYIYKLNTLYKKENSISKLIIFNSFGLIVGTTHEMIGVLFLLIISTRAMYCLVNKKVTFKKIILLNVGLIIGYLVCFFAPGNFNRANQTHSTKFTETYFHKLDLSFESHRLFIIGNSNTSLMILTVILTIAAFGLLFLIINKEWKGFIKDNFEYLIAIILSPFLWAVVPYCPKYALFGWQAVVLIVLFRLATNIPLDVNEIKKYYINIFLALIIIFLVVLNNAGWTRDMISTTNSWNELISAAKQENRTEVVVPQYLPSNNNIYTFYNYNNNPLEFTTDYYIKYYGLKVIPK